MQIQSEIELNDASIKSSHARMAEPKLSELKVVYQFLLQQDPIFLLCDKLADCVSERWNRCAG
jgi:hypothetical protein